MIGTDAPRSTQPASVGWSVRCFYDEHVAADALHEQLAAHDLAGGLVAEEPELAADVLFGAACNAYVEDRFAAHLLDSWAAKRSSLRDGDSGGAVGESADGTRSDRRRGLVGR